MSVRARIYETPPIGAPIEELRLFWGMRDTFYACNYISDSFRPIAVQARMFIHKRVVDDFLTKTKVTTVTLGFGYCRI